ncbi:Flagella-related protein FlaH [Dehalogenimonas sp. WBC-2]|nr:Flagella-related protein FlaH [Dehalogenimonas sp. WBC-2]
MVMSMDNKEEQAKRIISTGQSEINKKLGGGIPVNSLVLIEGQSDAGKSVLCQQMTWGSLNSDFKVVMFSTENTIKSLVSQMDSLGLDIMGHLLMGDLKIYPIKASQIKADSHEVFDRILDTIGLLDKFELFIVDSLTPAITQSSGDRVLRYFERCKEFCDEGKTIINVIHTYAFEQDFLIRTRSVCDAHLKLTIEKVGDKLVKSMEVAKIRGAAQTTGNVLAFDVEPQIGIKIMPISRAKA